MLWYYIIIFIISCFVLVKAAEIAVKYLAKVARFLRWSEFFVAFLLMAVATSLPELFVGITSAIHHAPQLAFGNIIGANIINLTFAVAGIVLLGGALIAESFTTQRTSVFAGLIAFLPLLLLMDKSLSRLDGLILLAALGCYFYWIGQRERRFSKVFKAKVLNGAPSRKIFIGDVFIFLAAVFFLVLSAEGIVWAGRGLTQILNLPLIVFGIIFVALGTTLPELIFSLKALKMGHKEMVLGNLMGSVIFNVGFVLAITVLISPFRIFEFTAYLAGIAFTILAVLFFRLFVKSDRRINKTEAWLLLAIYLAFVVVQFIL